MKVDSLKFFSYYFVIAATSGQNDDKLSNESLSDVWARGENE